MNRISLATAYLIGLSIVSFAQLPNATFVVKSAYSWKIPGNPDLTSATHQSAEFAPLNNLPFFPGGQRALEIYLHDLKLYPLQARINQREGTVQVRFRVMPSGDLTEIRVVQSSEPLLDQAAVQAVIRMPKWYPAHREGVAVSSLIVLPVTFRFN